MAPMRRVTWRTRLGLSGSYFAKVARDGGERRVDYRMSFMLFNTDGFIAAGIENAAGEYILGIGAPPLLVREGAGLTQDRHMIAPGVLPEGYYGCKCDAANEEGLLGIVVGGSDPVDAPPLITTPIGLLKDIRTLEVLCEIPKLPLPGQVPFLWALENVDAPTKTFGLTVDDAGTLTGILGSTGVVSTTIPTGQPLHIVLTRDEVDPDVSATCTVRLIVNGVEVDSAVVSTIELEVAYNIWGASSAGTPLPTDWLDVTFYHAGIQVPELSEAQCADHYASLEWTDVSDDVLDKIELGIERAIRDDGPEARVATAGTVLLGLNNSQENEHATLGYWTVGHEDSAPGWDHGVPIEVACIIDGGTPIVQFRGWVDEITTESGEWDDRVVHVMAADVFSPAENTQLASIPVQIDVTSDEVAQMLLARLKQQPPFVSFAVGGRRFPIVLDNSEDENTTIAAEFIRLQDSELGQTFPRRDGTFVWEARNTRILDYPAVVVTINGGFLDIDVQQNAKDAINRVQTTAHPRTLDDDDDVVLWKLEELVRVNQNEIKTIRGPYRNPNTPTRDARVGGIDMHDPPEADTDYAYNTALDGSGLDLTDSLEVTAEFSANLVTYTVAGRHPLYDGYLVSDVDGLPRLQVRGRGIYDFREAVMLAEDGEAIDRYGVNPVEIDMVYEPDPEQAQGAADLIMNLWGPRGPRARSVLLSLNDPDLPADLAERDCSDRVRVIDAMTALDAEYYIHGVQMQGLEGGEANVRWYLQPAPASSFWILGHATLGVLGLNTRLYFL